MIKLVKTNKSFSKRKSIVVYTEVIVKLSQAEVKIL